MNRVATLLAAMAVAVLAYANVEVGRNLMMPLSVAQERGIGQPWYLVWGLIVVTVACAVALIAFLVASSLRRPARR